MRNALFVVKANGANGGCCMAPSRDSFDAAMADVEKLGSPSWCWVEGIARRKKPNGTYHVTQRFVAWRP